MKTLFPSLPDAPQLGDVFKAYPDHARLLLIFRFYRMVCSRHLLSYFTEASNRFRAVFIVPFAGTVPIALPSIIFSGIPI